MAEIPAPDSLTVQNISIKRLAWAPVRASQSLGNTQKPEVVQMMLVTHKKGVQSYGCRTIIQQAEVGHDHYA